MKYNDGENEPSSLSVVSLTSDEQPTRGRRSKLLTDYSRFKADVKDDRGSQRSRREARSCSASRSEASLGDLFDDKDDVSEKESDPSLSFLDLEDDEEDPGDNRAVQEKMHHSSPILLGSSAAMTDTEDLTMEINRILIQTTGRSRHRALPNRSKTVPTHLFSNAKDSAADSEETAIDAQQSRESLRRFRQKKRNSSSTEKVVVGANHWHNSTGQLDLTGTTVPSGGGGPSRRSVRKSKSTIGSTTAAEESHLPHPASTNVRALPSRSKSISYTTTQGKNISEAGSSNNLGFLTGSRIKRTLHN